MENQEPKTEVKEEPQLNVAEEIEKLKAQKEELLKAQQEQAQKMDELAKLKAEVEELKGYKFPEQIEVKKLDDIELIEKKFEELTEAINTYPIGHEKRKPFKINDEYNGTNLLDGYYRYTKGEKVRDIFRKPYE